MAKVGKWSLQDAKAQFSEVVRRSLAAGPQRVTRNGEDAVVIVAARDFDRLARRRSESLGRFLASSPLADVDLKMARQRDGGRKLDL